MTDQTNANLAQNAKKQDTDHQPPARGIHVSNLGLAFDGHALFDALSFQAEAGCFTGILGPSGGGKTSLLKAIAGLHSCNPEAVICDQNGVALHNQIAWMAQKDLLLPWLSVVDNVCLGSRLRGSHHKAETRKRAMDLLAAIGLQDKAEQSPDTLSGGMRQRVALARTLMEDRPIVLMDEPFSAVDPLTRLSLQNLAAKMLRGRTVVFVTHDPLEALRIGHKVFVLNGAPATLTEISLPDIALPRPVDNPDVLQAQAQIMRALAPDQAGTL